MCNLYWPGVVWLALPTAIVHNYHLALIALPMHHVK